MRFTTFSLLVVFQRLTGQALAQIDIGTAAPFGILASTAITNTGATIVSGELGLSPNRMDSITGFPPGKADAIHAGDAVADQARRDARTAYNTAASLASNFQIAGADLGGQTLVSGTYKAASSVGITGTLTLDGQNDPNSIFVIQIGSTLTTASSSSVVLINGAQACNVFFQVGSSATLGTSTRFNGNILALTSISVLEGVSVNGGLYALNGAVTLINDQITPQRRCVVGTTSTIATVTSSTVVEIPTTASQATTTPVTDMTMTLPGSSITTPTTTPNQPGSPTEPNNPNAPDVPGVPNVPDTPSTPNVPDTPGTPNVPDTPGVPNVPDTPGTPNIPDTPGTPNVPDTPGVPNVPNIPVIPNIPGRSTGSTRPVTLSTARSTTSTRILTTPTTSTRSSSRSVSSSRSLDKSTRSTISMSVSTSSTASLSRPAKSTKFSSVKTPLGRSSSSQSSRSSSFGTSAVSTGSTTKVYSTYVSTKVRYSGNSTQPSSTISSQPGYAPSGSITKVYSTYVSTKVRYPGNSTQPISTTFSQPGYAPSEFRSTSDTYDKTTIIDGTSCTTLSYYEPTCDCTQTTVVPITSTPPPEHKPMELTIVDGVPCTTTRYYEEMCDCIRTSAVPIKLVDATVSIATTINDVPCIASKYFEPACNCVQTATIPVRIASAGETAAATTESVCAETPNTLSSCIMACMQPAKATAFPPSY